MGGLVLSIAIQIVAKSIVSVYVASGYFVTKVVAVSTVAVNYGAKFACAYKSLAQSYKQAIDELESNTGTKYEKLYIVGGGAKNTFLNRLTEEATGKKVIALPIEATALGNIKIQMEI